MSGTYRDNSILKLDPGTKVKAMMILILYFSMLAVMPREIYAEPSAPVKENKIIMATHRQADTYYGRWLYLIYTEAFKRLNYTMTYRYFPAKRASFMADHAEIAGELSRIYTYLDHHPNLVRVEESPLSGYFIAITSDPKIKLNGWDSLANTAYRVEYTNGIKRCEKKLSGLIPDRNLSSASNPILALRKLLGKRTDIFVDFDLSIIELLKSPEFVDAELYTAGIMQEVPIHAYLHKKYSFLAPKLSDVLMNMKKEGLIEKYRIEAKKVN